MEVTANLRGREIILDTGSGVFSSGRIDPGTRLLIESCTAQDSQDILDLGCGYGAVGVSIAKAFPHSRIVMCDVNERAVMLAKANIKKNRVSNAEAVVSDGIPPAFGPFDLVLLNPPQSAGKGLCLGLMRSSLAHLKPGGNLEAVMRHNVGGKDISEQAREWFCGMDVLGRKGGYRVYHFFTTAPQPGR